MKIALSNDHSVLHLKKLIIDFIESLGHEVVDCGTNKSESTHYPIYGKKVSSLVMDRKVHLGIVVCGTGVGITNSALKTQGIRAIHTTNPNIVKKARENYDINILGIGGRVCGIGIITECIKEFLSMPKKNNFLKKEIGLINSKK